MHEQLENQIGKLRALTILLASRTFMLQLGDYRIYLEDFIKRLILSIKNIRKYCEVNLKHMSSVFEYLDNLEITSSEYLSLISDHTLKYEKLADLSSEKITQIIEFSNMFIQEIHNLKDYDVIIEEVNFFKNKAIEIERIEKTLIPILKKLSDEIENSNRKISSLEEQLDISEKKIFELQAKISSLMEEKEGLQDRIQELLSNAPPPTLFGYDEADISEIEKENKSLKKEISFLREKLESLNTSKIDELEKRYKKEIDSLKKQLNETKSKLLDRIRIISEERNVWRAKAIQKQIYSLEDSIAEIKEQIRQFEQENKALKEERDALIKRINQLEGSD
ncbi:MAG: hypothetical protein ACTSYR_05385 [Candidatus Odinarchaeia archaeon]